MSCILPPPCTHAAPPFCRLFAHNIITRSSVSARMASSSPAHPSAHHPPLASVLYFERQQRLNCLRHSLNNLLQRPAFSTADLNTIASSITAAEGGGWLRSLTHKWPLLGKPLSSHHPPFRHTTAPTFSFILRTGNFDDEVMRVAAASCGLQLLWAMPERPGELPPILTSSGALLHQPHVVSTTNFWFRICSVSRRPRPASRYRHHRQHAQRGLHCRFNRYIYSFH